MIGARAIRRVRAIASQLAKGCDSLRLFPPHFRRHRSAQSVAECAVRRPSNEDRIVALPAGAFDSSTAFAHTRLAW